MGKKTPTGYSADVRMWLICGDDVIPLSHTAGSFVIAWSPDDLPPRCEAKVLIIIDGVRRTRDVILPHGMRSGIRETAIDNVPVIDDVLAIDDMLPF
jgi:hypothetical protein